jgi:ectoine hydroxylase-related dioxygenase (phytanoyl-CoA dioxygenase family)
VSSKTSMVQEQGLEIIPECFEHSEILSLRNALESTSLRRSRAGIRNALQIEAFRSVASDPRLLRLAQRTLGDNGVPFRATLFDKSPRSNWLVVWHQDTALPLRERREVPGWGPWSVKEGVPFAHAPAFALEQILAIRVHVDDSTAENGPLRILPETHTLGVLSDDSIHDLANRIPPVECHVPAGGLLLMRPLIVHASSKSTGTAQRRVLHIEYAAQACFAGGLELAA